MAETKTNTPIKLYIVETRPATGESDAIYLSGVNGKYEAYQYQERKGWQSCLLNGFAQSVQDSSIDSYEDYGLVRFPSNNEIDALFSQDNQKNLTGENTNSNAIATTPNNVLNIFYKNKSLYNIGIFSKLEDIQTSNIALKTGAIVYISSESAWYIYDEKLKWNLFIKDSSQITIKETSTGEKHWYINGEDSGLIAQGIPGEKGKDGKDGKDGNTLTLASPIEGAKKHWYINGEDTGVCAEGFAGPKGDPGKNGKDGSTPTLEKPYAGALNQWYINGEPTGVIAEGVKGDRGPQGNPGEKGEKGDQGIKGKDGMTPHIGNNGNWFMGERDLETRATGPQGPASVSANSLYSFSTNEKGELIITYGNKVQNNNFTIDTEGNLIYTVEPTDPHSTSFNLGQVRVTELPPYPVENGTFSLKLEKIGPHTQLMWVKDPEVKEV